MTDIITKYMPIVTVEHNEDGTVALVEIDWSDAQQYIEQPEGLEEAEAERLGGFFDKWLQGHPAHTMPGHHWEFEGTTSRKQQMINDLGSEEEASKYAEGAREIIRKYLSTEMTADEAWEEMRWELGTGDGLGGLDTNDPFLSLSDKQDIERLFRVVSISTINKVKEQS